MKILIAPYCKPMRNGKPHPKNYPVSYWKRVIEALKLNHEIIQIGITGEEILTHDFCFDLRMPKLVELIKSCDTFISVDTWLHHAAHHYGKRGIVIFSQSDPAIFGYPENINLLKDKKYLRPNQFWLWEQAEFIKDAFVPPSVVVESISHFVK